MRLKMSIRCLSERGDGLRVLRMVVQMIYKYILLLSGGEDKDIANCKSLQFI